MHFELSEQMTMIIIEALGEYKFRLAAPVISEMQRQINMQRQTNGKAHVESDRPSPSA